MNNKKEKKERIFIGKKQKIDTKERKKGCKRENSKGERKRKEGS
jgi:hypothetical protein